MAQGEQEDQQLREKFNRLVDALEEYVRRIEGGDKNWVSLDRHWIGEVGQKQWWLPARVAQRYCHPTRPFDPTPDFSEQVFPRSLRVDEGDGSWTWSITMVLHVDYNLEVYIFYHNKSMSLAFASVELGNQHND